MFVKLTFFSYIIDRIFGEFEFVKSYTHPVVLMGRYISFFEKKFYKDSIFVGGILTFSLIFIVFILSFIVQNSISNIIILAIIGSSTIALTMLNSSVKNIIQDPQSIKYLVSRDTQNLSNCEINKAAIETYSENLSDGVVAPLFYMLLFGLSGAFVYKAINTLDSMVGYKNKRYEKFGKISAKLDDIANFLPSRLTAILINIFFFDFKNLKSIYKFAKLHDSPNAGYPISAMALAQNLKLGGDTSYFGKIKKWPYFGIGKANINTNDIKKTIKFTLYFDIFILLCGVVYANF